MELEVFNGECISRKYMTLTYVLYKTIISWIIVLWYLSVNKIFEWQKPGAFHWKALNIIIVLLGEDVV